MSVLKHKRTESKAEFVNKANYIYLETLAFVTRLSNRYSRLIAQDIIHLASEVLDNCEKANSIFPSDDQRKHLRATHLLEARASLMALDVHLAHCYEILMQNPDGCIETASGRKFKPNEARTKLNKMAENLGCLIDDENALITKVLQSDKVR